MTNPRKILLTKTNPSKKVPSIACCYPCQWERVNTTICVQWLAGLHTPKMKLFQLSSHISCGARLHKILFFCIILILIFFFLNFFLTFSLKLFKTDVLWTNFCERNILLILNTHVMNILTSQWQVQLYERIQRKHLNIKVFFFPFGAKKISQK